MSPKEPPGGEGDGGLSKLIDLMASPIIDAKSISIAELEAILKQPPFRNLDPFPRLPVTPSMLYTYAHMLGKHPGDRQDTLHSALFPGRNRKLFKDKLWLPIFKREEISIEELPRGALYFWDPIVHVDLPLKPGIVELIVTGRCHPSKSPPPESYEEYIRRHPPTIGNHQYKGDQVYANFGYLPIGDKPLWVDPDSEGELYNAYINSTSHLPGLPHFKRTPPKGIMTPDEEDEFYKEYVEMVTDGVDGEGDPRIYRIAPATFARWAVGAVVGEHYEENAEVVKPRERPPPTQTYKPIPNRKPKKKMQFDYDTGSVLTGVYDVESDPSVMEEAEGVDALKSPKNYNYMNPQAAREIALGAFGGAWGDRERRGVRPEPAPTDPGVFTSEEGIRFLAEPGNPSSGAQAYYATKTLVQSLDFEYRQQNNQNWSTYTHMNVAGNTRCQLSEQVQFLSKHYRQENNMPLPHKHYDDLPSDQSEHDGLPIDVPPCPPTLRKQSKRKIFRRQVEEGIAQKSLDVQRERVTGVRLQNELDEILGDIEELKRLKELLLFDLGVERVEDIPNLVPKRRPRVGDLRANFRRRAEVEEEEQAWAEARAEAAEIVAAARRGVFLPGRV